jgi:phenylalanyl-tRNA synthetase beta chain
VRRAKAGESLLALDGKTYALTEEQVVIADQHGVESLAGIMGGEASGCDETTTDVLVESALWDPLNTPAPAARSASTPMRATASSAASIPISRRPGLDLATAMIVELCGGEPSEMVFEGDLPESARRSISPGPRSSA